MTDLTNSLHDLLREKRKLQTENTENGEDQARPTPAVHNDKSVNEFLKEAYRIVSLLSSLMKE